MNRREFVTQTCIACLGGGILSSVLAACESAHYVTGTMESAGISISKSEFTYIKNGESLARQFIVVHQDTLEYPIYVARITDSEFNALWMKCTHQGTELQAAGDHLYCTGHGSEFDKKGNVSQGPAEKNLRSFPVKVLQDKILIELT